MLKGEVELDSDVTTIGRSYENDVVIDNAGVSAHHARIIRDGDKYIIEDAASRNGIFVNGKRISRQPLQFDDDIEISKHTLKLSANASQGATPGLPRNEGQQTIQGATFEVDVSKLGELMKERQARTEAYLLLIGIVSMRSRYPLNKLTFNIGKSRDADIYTPGWFAPRLSAQIVRKNDGYYLVPRMRGKVRLNGMPVSAALRLDDGDAFAVRSLAFRFMVKQAEST